MTARTEVAWSPHPGSQAIVLSCPVFELLYEGTRGPGKTDTILMDFLQHVGQGYGRSWRGVLFREESTQLEDVRNKSLKWFPLIFPGAKYVGQPKDKWVFPDGEELLFRHMRRRADYAKYHGHEYPWIAWEELTNWASPVCYHLMKSCCRSSDPRVPRKYRATANPHGVGHNWVKAYFIDPAPAGVVFQPDMQAHTERIGLDLEMDEVLEAVRIRGHYSENRALMEAQPNYAAFIVAAAESPEQARAWLDGDWDIVAGGMFDDVWSRKIHVIPGWKPEATPESWYIDRTYDWGSSKPFSVGWWAESDGTTAPDGIAYPRGTLFRLGEWYGWNGQPNQGLRMSASAIGEGIVERERSMGILGRVKAGPGDLPAAKPGEVSMRDSLASAGARFVEPVKSPGSRHGGWLAMRDRLKAAMREPMEEPGLFVFEACRQFVRTIPTLPRDARDPDDVDTEAEDHIADETRYRCLAKKQRAEMRNFQLV